MGQKPSKHCPPPPSSHQEINIRSGAAETQADCDARRPSAGKAHRLNALEVPCHCIPRRKVGSRTGAQ